MSWLPDNFVHPVLVPLPGSGHHLRPIREADTPLDYPAVMGSRERLWTIFGPAWGWPAATMTYEADQADLLRHEKEIAAHQSFNYALFDAAETALMGCVYIDPPERAARTARSPGGWWTSWWAARSSKPSTRWCRSGSPPTGRSSSRASSAARSPGRTGSPCRSIPTRKWLLPVPISKAVDRTGVSIGWLRRFPRVKAGPPGSSGCDPIPSGSRRPCCL